MFFIQQILPAAMIALIMAVAICVAAARFGSGRTVGILAAFGLGIAYAGGHAKVAGWPAFPPVDSTHWLLFLAIAGAAIGALVATGTIPRILRNFVSLLFSAGALALILRPRFQHGWTPGEGALWLGVLTAATLVIWICFDLLARGSSPIALPLFAWISCAGMSVALMLSGSILLGQLASVLATALFAVLAVTCWRPVLGREAVPVIAVLFLGLLACGYFYAELPALSAVLLWLAPLVSLLPGQRMSWQALGIRVALGLIPVITAVVLAFRASPPVDYY